MRAILLLLLAAFSTSAEPAKWPGGASPENILFAHQRGLPDSIPVAVLCIRVDALGREISRSNGIGHIKLEDWLEQHANTIEQDATTYVNQGFVKMTVVYCGDVL